MTQLSLEISVVETEQTLQGKLDLIMGNRRRGLLSDLALSKAIEDFLAIDCGGDMVLFSWATFSCPDFLEEDWEVIEQYNHHQ